MRGDKNKSKIRGIQSITQGWRLQYVHQRPTGETTIRWKSFKHLDDAVKFKQDNRDIVL